MLFKRQIADLKRFKEIVGILFEEGIPLLFENTTLRKFIPGNKRIKKGIDKIPHEVRLRKTLERLGPTFIKFGQLLSIRPDLIPYSYIRELEKLQNDTPSFDYSEVKKIIEESAGKKISTIFSKFEKVPVASASIAQVHKAWLKDGTMVAVKVRRPNIEEVLKNDMEILYYLAQFIDKHVKGLQKYKPVAIVEEFSYWTSREVNFNIETENMMQFYDNFKNSKTTVVPKVFTNYCSDKLIVMEFLDGIELNRIGKSGKKRNIKKALQNGFRSALEQVFVHGLFHGDPHPSNILLLKNHKVGFVDYGIVGRFDDELKKKAVDLFTAITSNNAEAVIEVLLAIGEAEEDIDMYKFRKSIFDAMITLRGRTMKDIKISKVLENVLDIALKYGLKLPCEFILFGKMIVTLEGISLLYYPDFNLAETAEPFIEDIIMSEYEPKRLIKNGIMKFFKIKKTVERMPEQASRVLDKLEHGKIKIEMKDTDIEKLSIELDKSSNRLTYGMIFTALLISGSLVINVGQGIFFGVPLMSLLLFASAGIMALAVLVSIYHEHRSFGGK